MDWIANVEPAATVILAIPARRPSSVGERIQGDEGNIQTEGTAIITT